MPRNRRVLSAVFRLHAGRFVAGLLVLTAPAWADEAERPRVMHAEYVTTDEKPAAKTLKVAEKTTAAAPVPAAPPAAERRRMFDMPVIDKSKAEDPYKSAPPPVTKPAPPPQTAKPAAPAPSAAPSAAAPAARTAPRRVLKLPELESAQELSRQQREMMLATSGPRKAPSIAPLASAVPAMGARRDPAGCAGGKRQSPIDIRDGIRVDLEPIRFDYRPTPFRIIDTGRTVEVKPEPGNGIAIMGRMYLLTSIVFHRPGEEYINGRSYEMSVHLIHRDGAGNQAVIAVLLDRGAEHAAIQMLWNHLPLEVGMEVAPPEALLDLAKLLPARREYYTYMGSLTLPPCTENVLWMVLKEPIGISPEQIAIFARLYPDNARPLQPANGRLIKESR
jgi:carbonic anhydrase